MTTSALLRDPYVAAFPEHLPFWEAAQHGRLLLPRCTACGRVHWHPRLQCPFCRSLELRWEPASGRGRLHTYSLIPGPAGETVLAYVRLEQGPLMLANVVDARADDLRIDMPLAVAFRVTREGRAAPVFRPA